MFEKSQTQDKPKIDYSKVKKCVLKKEIGEHTEECKEVFKKLGVEEWNSKLGGKGMDVSKARTIGGFNKKDSGIDYQKAHKDDYKEKLKDTKVLSEDYKKVIKKYGNNKKSFIYADPPYVGTEKVYKEHEGVTPEDVCQIAKSIDGKMLISYNDHPRVRKACRGLHIKGIGINYTLGIDKSKKSKELLIANYKIWKNKQK